MVIGSEIEEDMCMQRAKRLRTVLIAAAICATASAAADDSSYRLSLANSSVLRLRATEPSERSDASPIDEALADKPYARLINAAAREAALDPALVHALIYVESRYNAAARSSKGAIGLMQLLPDTAARYGVADPARSVEGNLRAGTRYLRDLMRLFDGRIELALAAYNAGENAVQRYGNQIPPYRETREYVPAVLEKYKEWKAPLVATAALVSARVRISYLAGTILDPDSVRSQANR